MVLYKSMGDISTIELEILTLAQKGHSRIEFKKNASTLICHFFSCQGLDIYIREEKTDYTWITRRELSGDYSFRKAEELSEITQSYRQLAVVHEKSDLAFRLTDRGVCIVAAISIDETREGLIACFREPDDSFSVSEQSELLAIKKVFEKAVFFRNSQAALHERIKELTCIYEITKIMHKSREGIENTLHDVIKRVPSAFQYEDSAASRIVLDGQEYACGNVNGGPYSLRSGIVIAGSERGHIEVSYETEEYDLEEKSFLLEEQNLLDGIAKQLSLLIEEKEVAVERLKLEDQLRHADRLATIGQLAAGVAHEINEPLANILGFSELIKKDPGLSGQTSKDLDKIIRASMYARDTVKKLLMFAGKIQPGETKINLNTIITEGIQFFENRCSRNSIKVQTDLDSDLPDITADSGQINQVVINLLVNSIQVLPSGGEIRIRSGIKDDMVYFSVEDNGSGIPEEIRDSIFLPFFTTKGLGEGTGLGLVVVHGIIQAYKGSIDVQSSVGEYTRFTVYLPRQDSNE